MGKTYYKLKKNTRFLGLRNGTPVIDSEDVERTTKSAPGMKFIRTNTKVKGIKEKFGAEKTIKKKSHASSSSSKTNVHLKKSRGSKKETTSQKKPNAYLIFCQLMKTQLQRNKSHLSKEDRSEIWADCRTRIHNDEYTATKTGIKSYIDKHVAFD